jgi:hypothetical protein
MSQKSRGLDFKASLGKYFARLYLKNTTNRAGGVVEHLPIKCEALSSNPSTDKKFSMKCTDSLYNRGTG